jgi:NADH dehydrogenase
MSCALPKNITLFGGTGFLGRVVAQALARAGCCLRIPTRRPDAAESLQTIAPPGRITFVPALFRTDAEAERTVGSADAIVNMIGLARENRAVSFQFVHVELAARIARLAQEMNVATLLHFSSLEADVKAPSRYGRSKALGEEAVRAFFPTAVIFRPSQIFGPNDPFFTKIALLARLLPFVPLLGNPNARRQVVYAGDVAEAVKRALASPATHGRVFELGGPDIWTRRAMVNATLRLGNETRRFLPLPMALARPLAGLGEAFGLDLLPTRDQLHRTQAPSVVTALPENTLTGLGITPAGLDALLPGLVRGFRTA